MTHPRYDADELTAFARAMLEAAGLDAEKARVCARTLVEGDLLGYGSHGLQLLKPYLGLVRKGHMARSGRPDVVADRGASVVWDGRTLPGPWLVHRAIDLACERIGEHGVVAVAIRRSQHIGCLGAYLARVTDRGLAMILASSEPSSRLVAPYGGVGPLLTTNPIAACWPTDGAPVWIDVSTSITNMRRTRRVHADGGRLRGAWAMANDGEATDDPGALFTDPPGSLLPVGGLDHGHKGFAIGLLVEMLTSGLAGFGRADAPEGWTTSVFLQVIDPAAFAGDAPFRRETGWLAEACRGSPPAPWFRERGHDTVAVPGDIARAHRARSLAEGIALTPALLPELAPLAAEHGVALPAPRA